MNKNLIAEFLGWYFGDGCLSTKNKRYQFSITGDLNEEILFYKEVVAPVFNQLFDRQIKVKEYQSVGVCGIYVFFVDY